MSKDEEVGVKFERDKENKGNDSNELQKTSRLIIKNIPSRTNESGLKRHFEETGGIVTDVKIMKTHDGKNRNFAFVGFRTVEDAAKAKKSFNNTFYLTSKITVEHAQTRNNSQIPRPWSKYSQNNFHCSSKLSEEKSDFYSNVKKIETTQPRNDVDDMELLSRSGRLFLTNLTYSTSVEDLEEVFAKYGELLDVHVVRNKLTGDSKGMAFVQYTFPVHAIKAYDELNGSIFQGRLIKIVPAEEPPTKSKSEDLIHLRDTPVSFQSEYQKKKMQKMQNLRNQDFNWNTLFVRSSTAVEATALKLNVDKSQILDSNQSGCSMAVRVALSETSIVNENKNFLKENGVSLTALEKHDDASVQRSSTCILVKNLPPNTSVADLTSVFSPYGDLNRLVMPPARTIALVDFSSPNDAKKAFKFLAYKRFGDAPLFLEWAPEEIIERKEDANHVSTAASSEEKLELYQDVLQRTSHTLFVKNLSFQTSEKQLLDFFNSTIGGVVHASIASRTVGNRTLSNGFGFVEFKDHQLALKAWKVLNNTTLDGHEIFLEFAKVSQQQKQVINDLQQATSKRHKNLHKTSQKSSKLTVKNLPFEATKKELYQLFSPFGMLKSIRVPKKAGGVGHRGFAFVEYSDESEASTAIQELSSTHLYGRHLVIEYANADDSLL